LLDPTKRLHRYLFEHHPERNAWSFFRTLAGGLLPRRFWRGLQPAQPSRPKRLLAYWLLASLLTFGAVFIQAAQSVYVAASVNQSLRAAMLFGIQRNLATPSAARADLQGRVDRAGGAQALVDETHPPTWGARFFAGWYRYYPVRDALQAPLVFAIWPWLTFATLMIFATSMRRAKVRPVHVLRCAVYCCDAGVWIVPLALLVFFASAAPSALARHMPLPTDGLILATFVLPFYTTYRLAAAYRLYLRFDHPFATAAASQVIAPLVALAALKLLASG
jgi:hypothetical protein